jgi:hypothetical protein
MSEYSPHRRFPLGLARVEHQMFQPAEGRPFGWDDHIYFPDLMRSYGLDCPMEQFDRQRNSFTDMIAMMLPRLHPFDDHFDIAVLSAVTPDSQAGYPMCYLAEATRLESGLGFGVMDQGVIAPFTALSVLATYVRAERATRGLLLIIDQSTLLHTRPVIPRLRVALDSAVALVWDAADPIASAAEPRSFPVPATVQVGGYIAQLLGPRAWAGTSQRRVLVCGYGLAEHLTEHPAADQVLRASPGLPATGAWALVAAQLPHWQASGASVLVADFDQDQHRLSTCVIEVPPRP